MWEHLSNRHRGDLNGRLTDTRLPAKVTVLLSGEVAARPVAQHLTWMLVNLLARQTHEIQSLEIVVPEGIPALERLSPLISPGGDLGTALRAGIAHIHPGVLEMREELPTHVTVRVGPGPLAAADLSLATTASGWSGYIGQEPTAVLGQESYPIGAYVAASLCAGEIFKFVRGMRPDAGEMAQHLWLDAATLTLSDHPPHILGPVLPSKWSIRPAVLAGVGAVGNGVLHTLYALPALQGKLILVDYDPKGITDTNLNRYVCFGLAHIGALKASAAAQFFPAASLKMTPVDLSWQQWWEMWSAEHPEQPLEVVLSAVDKNTARHAIQDALPRLIIGASTNEMRAQVTRYDVRQGGPCLRCYNPPEPTLPDAEIIAQLRNTSTADRAMQAQQLGVHPDDLERYLADPGKACGLISGATLQQFASQPGDEEQGAWAVGFVSLLAGILLAAEYLKLGLASTLPALEAQRNTFRFQFWRPERMKTNRIIALPPEQGCLCQMPVFQRVVATW